MTQWFCGYFMKNMEGFANQLEGMIQPNDTQVKEDVLNFESQK